MGLEHLLLHLVLKLSLWRVIHFTSSLCCKLVKSVENQNLRFRTSFLIRFWRSSRALKVLLWHTSMVPNPWSCAAATSSLFCYFLLFLYQISFYTWSLAFWSILWVYWTFTFALKRPKLQSFTFTFYSNFNFCYIDFLPLLLQGRLFVLSNAKSSCYYCI